VILAQSVREWILLLARKKLAELREVPPVWLPDYALVEARPFRLFGLFTLGFALLKELSGEAELERAHAQVTHGECAHPGDRLDRARLYVATTEQRYRGVRRCC